MDPAGVLCYTYLDIVMYNKVYANQHRPQRRLGPGSDAILAVAVKAEERRRATYLERLRSLETRLREVRLRERPADLLRADRERA